MAHGRRITGLTVAAAAVMTQNDMLCLQSWSDGLDSTFFLNNLFSSNSSPCWCLNGVHFNRMFSCPIL